MSVFFPFRDFSRRRYKQNVVAWGKMKERQTLDFAIATYTWFTYLSFLLYILRGECPLGFWVSAGEGPGYGSGLRNFFRPPFAEKRSPDFP
ncbi:uncharacterized protein LY89DRAFT_236303 [Mollisia scopiformis]|uniref:Uncharacterized protein n=1 Tax=Mollisia scopiformis TaxID=149040 RepID=A0A194WSY4_MOLSC|nr:uncharacterized protein LY89DRAFT_236303 [Mollisia scopiformis]KUJ11070.1 hypothetical protein LY89DRAFT_236303 [Mollisia scopiformis]